MQLFARVQSPRDSERRTQGPRVGLARNPPSSSRLPKAVPNVMARRLSFAYPAVPSPSPPRAHANPVGVSCRLSRRFNHPLPPRPARKTTREPRACIDHARKLHRCALSVTSGKRGKLLGGCFRGARAGSTTVLRCIRYVSRPDAITIVTKRQVKLIAKRIFERNIGNSSYRMVRVL